MKRCFTCKRNKPLFLYGKNNMKYMLSSDKGRLVECRLCSCKRLIKQKGRIARYNFDIKKFEMITIKPTLINLVKEYFRN